MLQNIFLQQIITDNICNRRYKLKTSNARSSQANSMALR